MPGISFDPGRARDAWATLRGYVYQAAVTIDRWLDLDEDEVLELERGEDIDLVGRIAGASGDERERLLEQVKHLEASITLRSEEVRVFLANALAHHTSNPELRLRFRFTTTADPGTERATPIPGKIPGIVAWEQIRTGTWPVGSGDQALSAIRELLKAPATPNGLPATIWTAFQDFLHNATSDEFEAFLRACEWSTGHVRAADYESRVRAKLVEMGQAAEPGVAGSLHDRLQAFVFRRLTQSGVKRLTRADFLEQVALWRDGVPLSPEDDRRVREIGDLVHMLEKRVDAVEMAVDNLKVVTAGSAARLDHLARQHGVTAALEYVALSPTVQEPPGVDRASERRETVASLLAMRGSASWIALHGVSGIGKSELALLIARAVSDTRVWVRFRDLSVPQACMRYDAALAVLAGLPAPSLTQPGGWAAEDPRPALTPLGSGAVIVLDDVPRFRPGDELSVRLMSLARAAAREGILLLSTGPLPVPEGVVDSLPPGLVAAVPAPLFSVEEVREVLSAFGAGPAWQNDTLVLMVHTSTRGHPTLVRACARDLAQYGWGANFSTIKRILGTGYAAGVNDETIRSLLDSAPDAHARELLFRLNIIDGEFGIEEVQMLASVDPPIPAPRTHLDPLLGLWVQADTGGRYAVSPLVRPLGSSELGPTTQRDCHRMLGRQIVSRDQIGELQAIQAVNHFVAAEEFDSAGWVVIRVLLSLREMDVSGPRLPLVAHVWLDMALPEGMDPGLRLMIRALQLGLCVRSGRDVTYVREDLDRLTAPAGEGDQWAMFTASMFAAQALSSVDVAGAGGYLLRALRLRSWAVSEVEKHGLPAPAFPLEQMVWLMGMELHSTEALREWLDLIEGMTPTERAAAFQPGDLAESGALHVANQIMFREEERSVEERDWPGVLNSLRLLTERARAMDLHRLTDGAIMARMTVQAEFLRDSAAAEALAEEALAREGLDAEATFLLTNHLSLLLYDYGSAEDAIEWLQRAFVLRTPEHASKAVRAAIFLSVRVGKGDARGAIDILTEAADFAESHAESAGLSRVEVFAEMGVAKWLEGDLVGAFDPWDRAATLLLEAQDDSPGWRSVYVVFAHVTGYFASLARSGRAPDPLQGREPYAVPTRGLFTIRPSGRDTGFDESKLPGLAVQLAIFADAVGARSRAAAWAHDAVTRCAAVGWHGARAIVLPMLVAEALEDDDYGVALALFWERQAVWEAVRIAGPGDMSAPDPAPTDVLGAHGGDPWLVVEAGALSALILIYYRLALLERDSDGAALSRLSRLNDALAACADRSADQAPWAAAANLFNAIFKEGATSKDLVALVNGYEFREREATRALKALGYTAASTHPGTRLEHSLALQLATGPFIGRLVLPGSHAFGDLAGEFYGTFWRERFQTARFRFSNPREVERLLDAADQTGPDRVRRTLAAAASGLSVNMPPEVREWLRAEHASE